MKRTRLPIISQPKSPIAEAFRTLRTNIQFTNLDRAAQVVLVTSPGQGEGKTTVTSNLSVAMARSNVSVVVVDCDLRRPAVHRAFGLPNNIGLSNLIVENREIEEVIKPALWDSGVQVITAGTLPPNPSEMLASARNQAFLERLRGLFDLVVLDSPPVLPVADTLALGNIADGVLLVIEAGGTRIEEAQQAVAQLRQVGARLLGVVLNKVDLTRPSNHYYYYRNYGYDSYYGQEAAVASEE